ncbi:MAG: M23 family metallopeptidase [Gammaproteobacteria bacterium]|nr:M23 family metallopeptidase [Gammaproteobacteria bacterium]
MDYMDFTEQAPSNRLRYVIIATTLFITGAIISHFFENHTHASTKKATTTLALPADQKTKMIVTPNKTETQTLSIRKNDTLASLFHRAGLPSTLWMTVLKLPPAAKNLEQLQIGGTIDIATSPSHEFTSLNYTINPGQTLQVLKQGNYLVAHILQKPITKALRFKTSIIHHSLAQAEKSAGLPADLQHELNAMFASNGISHEVRPGDRLNVLYHQYFAGDQKDHPGNIVAAEIVDGHNHYRMVRFTEGHHAGYFTPSGQGTKPLFLSSPLNYRRIGSYFSYDRFDPIAHRVQPHLGVDYDAPIGTPVKALSNGIVVFCKKMNGYGNVIMVRYNNTYKSFYAHLGRFAAHLRPNEVVKKGEVIGYVGMTGWTTGPHLHFSVYKDGKAVNPLTVKFPHTSPIEEKYRRAFYYKENHWFNEMNLFETAHDAAKK